MRILPAVPLILIVTFAPATAHTQQSDYEARTLKVKEIFSQRTLDAMGEPFVGVTRDGVVEFGLFPIYSTGVSTEPVVMAAANFLATLSQSRKCEACIPLKTRVAALV